jgi:hypothetical protein
MDLKSLTDRVKGIFQSRGGAEAAKTDAKEVVDIAKGPGSMTDKAKDAAEALKDPGAPGQGAPGQDAPSQGTPGQNAPSQGAPGQDAPGQDAPGQDAPSQGAPGPDR